MSFLIAKYSKHNKHSCININHYFNDYGIILQGRTHIISSKLCYRVTGNKHITSLLLIISIVILHQICLFCSKLLQQKRSSCANNFTPIYCPRIQSFQNKAELDFFFPKIWRKVFTIFFKIKYSSFFYRNPCIYFTRTDIFASPDHQQVPVVAVWPTQTQLSFPYQTWPDKGHPWTE